MTKTTILDIDDLKSLEQLLRPNRETRLLNAMDYIDTFVRENCPDAEFDSSVLLTMMEQLTDDLSLVLDVPFALWSIEHFIDSKWDLACQCSRINRLCRYNIILWKVFERNNKKMVKAYEVESWSEKLPEKH